MSGGRLVVLDRAGRDVKRYSLPSGLVTLGSDASCDIRVMLPAVSAHHATVTVRAHQTVIRSVSDKVTLVNGAPVSVLALQHGDTITLGDRSLRWEYEQPGNKPCVNQPAFIAKRGAAKGGRGRSRASEVGMKRVDKDVELMLELKHRASMPSAGPSGAKQVAIVQPQRRDTNENQDTKPGSAKRARSSTAVKQDTAKLSPARNIDLQTPTKASLWIESRKSSPRKPASPVRSPAQSARRALTGKKATPLRTAVLRRTVTPSHRVAKIHAPTTIDYMKQAALMLMTRHTPKTLSSSLASPKRGPSLVVKKTSPITPKSAKGTPKSAISTPKSAKVTPKSVKSTPKSVKSTPKRQSSGRQSKSLSAVANDSSRSSRRNISANQTVSILEISDTDRRSKSSSRIATPNASPPLPSPKKSSLKHPKSARKNESIKFDLSNLENYNDISNDIFIVSDVKTPAKPKNDRKSSVNSANFSDTLTSMSPSPRRSLHSRSSKILQSTIGSTLLSQSGYNTSTLTPQSASPRKSVRGSLMVQNALSSPKRSPRKNLESYSIVDLADDTQSTFYDSATPNTTFGTPQSRKTRSTINALESSTPYVQKGRTSRTSKRSSLNITSDTYVTDKSGPKRSKSAPETSTNTSRASENTRYSDIIDINASGDASITKRGSRTKSLDSPQLSVTQTRRSGSRSSIHSSPSPKKSLNKSAVTSPKTNLSARRSGSQSHKNLTINTSKASSKSVSPKRNSRTSSRNGTPQTNRGNLTPESEISPSGVGTPVLNIQSLLDSSLTSNKGKQSHRKTFGGRVSKSATKSNKKGSKSFNASVIRTVLTRRSKDSSGASDRTDENAPKPSNDDTITPKSTVKLVQEAVKEKHSTAKKPFSKRSIIDNLNDSDIVKQLFASPVKRNLSRSMTEFTESLSKERAPKRKARNTIALGRTPNNSLLNNTAALPTDVFVSPINTPQGSPASPSAKRMHASNSPKSPIAVRSLIRTPRARKSVKNDLTNIPAIKDLFAKSPRNRLSDFQGVKQIFTATSPNNDLRRVSGVKSLFQSERKTRQPKNSLSNVSGVRKLYKRNSPANDLTNVSGVKKILSKSPKNDLRDVRGVKKLFAKNKSGGLCDLSGVEELFHDSSFDQSSQEDVFDQLIGKKTVKATYSKSFVNKSAEKPNKRSGLSAKSLNSSYQKITSNVEQWIEDQLRLRLSNDVSNQSVNKSSNKSNKSGNVSKALQKLFTDTVEGSTSLQRSRSRNTTLTKGTNKRQKSASGHYRNDSLPLKKRSLERQSDDKSLLPIKKRALVSSTPVKGKLSVPGADLGRMSPIVGFDEATAIRQSLSPKPKSTSPKRASKRSVPITTPTTSPKRKPVSPKPKTTPRKSLISPKNNTSKIPTASPRIASASSKKNTLSHSVLAKLSFTSSNTPKNTTVTRKSKTPTASPLLKVTPKTVTRKSKPVSPKAVSVKKSPKQGRKSSLNRKTTPKAVISRKSGPISPRKATPKAVSPRKATPKAVSPRKTTPKAVSPRKATPIAVSPRKATPKAVSPRKTTPKAVSPRKATPKAVSSRKATPTAVSPRKATPKAVSPRKATPKAVSPRKATPKAVSPRKATPKSVSLKKATPKAVSPRKTTLKAVSPRKATPKAVSPRKATPKAISPRRALPKANTPKKAITPRKISPKKNITKTPKVRTPKEVTKASPKTVTPKPKRQTRKALAKVVTPKKSTVSRRKPVAPKLSVSPKKVVLSPKPRTTRRQQASPKTKIASPKKANVKTAASKTKVQLKITTPKPKRGAKRTAITPIKPSPIKRAKKEAKSTEVQPKAKKGPAFTLAKKAPIASPVPKATRRGRNQAVSPAKKQATPKPSPKPKRGAKVIKVATPKVSRAKARLATVVISKPSPQIKPASKPSPIKAKATRGRNQTQPKSPSPTKPKGRQTKKQPETKIKTPAKKTTKAVASKTKAVASKTKASPKLATPKPKRGQGNAPKSPSPKKSGGRKVAKVSPVLKGRKRKVAEIEPEKISVAKKGKVSASPVKAAPKGRKAGAKSPKVASKSPKKVAASKGKKPQSAAKEAPKSRKRKSETSPAASKKSEPAVKRSRATTKPKPSPAKTTKTATANATARSRRR